MLFQHCGRHNAHKLLQAKKHLVLEAHSDHRSRQIEDLHSPDREPVVYFRRCYERRVGPHPVESQEQ